MEWNRICCLTTWVWLCLGEFGSASVCLGLPGWHIVATQPTPFHSILGMEWNEIGFVGLLAGSVSALVSLGLAQSVWVRLAGSLSPPNGPHSIPFSEGNGME